GFDTNTSIISTEICDLSCEAFAAPNIYNHMVGNINNSSIPIKGRLNALKITWIKTIENSKIIMIMLIYFWKFIKKVVNLLPFFDSFEFDNLIPPSDKY